MMTTRPTSPAKSRMRSSAGSVRLATSPAIFEDTNSLWIVNSPMPGEHAGKGLQHAPDVIGRVHVGGLKPVIIGSKRACCFCDSDLYAIAMKASVKE